MERVHYINAGAGAGKTTSLVKILRQILTEKNSGNYICKPSEIILTTYTKAAAKEFREKTFKILLEAQNGKPAPIEVAKILDTATIGTVHSVAEQYIQRYWSLLYYSGQFNILSDVDKETYINRSLRNLVKDKDIQFFNQYAETFNITDSRTHKINHDFWKDYVKSIISKMHAYNITTDQLSGFCRKSCSVVRKLFTVTYNPAIFISYATDTTTALSGTNSKDAKERMTLYDNFILLTSPSVNEIKQFLESEFFTYKAKDAAKKSLEDTKNYLQTCCIMSPDSGKTVQKCIKLIFKIVADWEEEFNQYKRINNLLDFDDLEVKFLELLGNKAVQDDIRSSVKYLFVDEFQDSNPIQLEIFKKLSDLVQEKSYWVGDPKQAIYGFRGSDSSLTTQLLNEFPKPERKPKNNKNFQFTQNENKCSAELIDTSWRSIKSLVQLSNEVFKQSFNKGVKTERIKNVPLKHKRNDKKIKNPIQHWHCDSYDALATRVAEILNGKCPTIPGVYEEDAPWNWRKKIVPSDIAILTSLNDDCSTIAEALRAKNIPVALAETDIRDKAEVKLVLALLKYIANTNRKYAKIELTKLLEDRNLESILKDLTKGRFEFIPSYDKKDSPEKSEEDATAVAGSTTTATIPLDKDPDKLFGMLDDKLKGLRGLNISAIIKGVIAVLDLRNVVAKWGMTKIRQDNLDMLIAQASAFEMSTSHTPDSTTVSDFIDYLRNVKIDAQLDQSADGVKVATFHKSKGLQWKIVILDSLTKDDLKLETFIGKNWIGINQNGGYNSAKLQFIPSFGPVNSMMAEQIVALKKKRGDNGYYNLLLGKREGEIKRLLYVGVTRARDYLITMSKGKKPLTWVQNVRQDSLPSKASVLGDIDNQTNGSMVDIWGVPKHPALYEKISDNPSITFKKTSAKATKLKTFATSTETIHKTISPSSSKEKYAATPSLVTDFTSPYITHNSIKDSAAFGTCIHNYMAAHRWEGTARIKGNEPANIALATQTVKNHTMQDVLPNPELLTQAADALFTYLESQFGPAKELLRECPFTYCRDKNGQIVSGEIDLIWKINDKDCVLVDHKNFPAGQDYGKNIVLQDKPDNKFYVGKYFPQLGDYRAALNAAGMNVIHVFVFYAVLGCLVEVEF